MGIIVFVCACRKQEKYSIIPEIKFINFEKLEQNSGILTFYFQDGDGDIGLNSKDIYPPFDTSSYYYYNFFCDYFEKQNGIFEKIDSIENHLGEMIPVNLNARIPRVSTLPEESVNGEIYITIQQYRDIFSKFDTIKLEFHIVDRKLHESNVEEVVVIR
jgi:hypothetical protein